MAKDPVKDQELEEFQAGLKYKMRYLSSLLSIILIIMGLYLLLNGLFGLAVKDPQSDNATSESEIVITGTGSEIKPSIDGAISTGRVEAATLSASEKAIQTQAEIERTGHWKATDYVQGDIGLGEYEVKLGDTLWEISEAVYGSGFDWNKLLSANSSSIGFLPDGSQALIIPGQILKIVK